MKHVNAAEPRGRDLSRPASPIVLRQLSSSVLHTTRHPSEASGLSVRPIRVVIVVAEQLFGEALGGLLSGERGLEIVGQVAQGAEAIEVIQNVKPDVVLLDASLPEIEHTEVIRLIKQHSPESRILLLTAARNDSEIGRGLKAGANGFVSKNAGLSDVTKAIHGVHQGDIWVERKLLADVLWGRGRWAVSGGRTAGRSDEGLTAREDEILRALTSGGTNRHIAEALFISERTVKTHLNNIFRKLNVNRRLQAVLYAVQHGLRGP